MNTAPSCRTVNLDLHCRVSPDNSRVALVQKPLNHLLPTNWEFRPVEIASLHFDGPPVTTYGFTFPDSVMNSDSGSDSPPPEYVTTPCATAKNTTLTFRAGDRSTKIRPPNNIIKLEDRLYYLLQPPLETLLANRSLEFPCTPFAYQLEGVGFLFPRHARAEVCFVGATYCTWPWR